MILLRLRPYHVENTSSRPITEVKQRRAWLVLGWVTAWERAMTPQSTYPSSWGSHLWRCLCDFW